MAFASFSSKAVAFWGETILRFFRSWVRSLKALSWAREKAVETVWRTFWERDQEMARVRIIRNRGRFVCPQARRRRLPS